MQSNRSEEITMRLMGQLFGGSAMNRISKGWKWALVSFLLLVVCPSLVIAQTAGTGGLAGIVTDATGAVVPNVTVTATSADTGQVRAATTGPDGSYNLSLL